MQWRDDATLQPQRARDIPGALFSSQPQTQTLAELQRQRPGS
jgi:hypothetical protein